jgi:hypothetical protein
VSSTDCTQATTGWKRLDDPPKKEPVADESRSSARPSPDANMKLLRKVEETRTEFKGAWARFTNCS